MTYKELVKFVADEFRKDLEFEGFDSFEEMVRCYQMDSDDIKREVVYTVNQTGRAYMDDETGEITLFDDDSTEPYKYRSFIAKVRKELKA